MSSYKLTRLLTDENPLQHLTEGGIHSKELYMERLRKVTMPMQCKDATKMHACTASAPLAVCLRFHPGILDPTTLGPCDHSLSDAGIVGVDVEMSKPSEIHFYATIVWPFASPTLALNNCVEVQKACPRID